MSCGTSATVPVGPLAYLMSPFVNFGLHVHLNHTTLFVDAVCRFFVENLLSMCGAAVSLVFVPMMGIAHTGNAFLTLWLQAWATDSFGGWTSMLAPVHISIGVVIPAVGFLSLALGTALLQPEIAGEGYIFHVMKWLSIFKYGFQAIVIKELPRATSNCSECIVPSGQGMLATLNLAGEGFEKTLRFQYLMLIVLTLALRTLAFFTVRLLIMRGNRRYTYDTSSAGETPSDEGVSSPTYAGHRQPFPTQGAPDAPAATFKWTMSRVFAQPSIVEKALNASAYELAKSTPLLSVQAFTTKAMHSVAIMGPSGSGKSLLLRSLCGRQSEGTTTESPTVFCSDRANATVQLVDGTDGIYPNLLVAEPVEFHAALFGDSSAALAAAEQLLALGIAKDKHNDPVYTLSGGQMQRLAIACKAVLKPAVLCIDEPTSGLDHDAAVRIGAHLRALCREHRTSVICTLQQPDAALLNQFDVFVFMSNGSVAVHGDEATCRQFFGISTDCRNWAEEALVVLSGKVTVASEEPTLQDLPQPDERVAVSKCVLHHLPHHSTLYCMYWLTKRCILTRWVRAPLATLTAFCIRYLLINVILSVLLLQIGRRDPFYLNRRGLIYLHCCSVTFSSLLNAAVTFPTQRKAVKEEIRANLYTTTSYLLSQWYANHLVEDFIGCVLGSIAVKYIAGLNADLGVIIAASFVVSQCSDCIGFLCGLHRSLAVACGSTIMVLIPFMVGADVIVSTAQVARVPILYYLEVISTVRYGYLIIFWSELEQSDPAGALAVYASYGLQAQPKWSDVSTLWPVFCGYMVLLRLGTLLLYKVTVM